MRPFPPQSNRPLSLCNRRAASASGVPQHVAVCVAVCSCYRHWPPAPHPAAPPSTCKIIPQFSKNVCGRCRPPSPSPAPEPPPSPPSLHTASISSAPLIPAAGVAPQLLRICCSLQPHTGLPHICLITRAAAHALLGRPAPAMAGEVAVHLSRNEQGFGLRFQEYTDGQGHMIVKVFENTEAARCGARPRVLLLLLLYPCCCCCCCCCCGCPCCGCCCFRRRRCSNASAFLSYLCSSPF
jgi:hypothetical protein